MDYEAMLLRNVTAQPGPLADQMLRWLVTGERPTYVARYANIVWPDESIVV